MADATWGAVAGLGAAVAWGAGDFAGGLATRRASVFRVSVVSQFVGLTLLLVVALLSGEALPDARTLGIGALAGVSGGAGLLALYHALSVGRMGVAAPVSAVVTAIVPALVGAWQEGVPAALRIGGFALALLGVWLLARPEGAAGIPKGVGSALLAGLGFGALLTLLAQAEGAFWWPLVVARFTSALLLGGLAVARRDWRPPASREAWLAVGAGVMDVTGNALFILSAAWGRLDVAGVLSSLFPASTVALARVVLHEKLSVGQWLGVGVVLVAIPLIAW